MNQRTARIRAFPALVATVLLISACASVSPPPTPTPRRATTPSPTALPLEATLRAINVKLGRDAVYCTPGGEPLRIDVYYPLRVTEIKPVVMYVHSGGWTSSTKSDIAGSEYQLELLRRGYLVASPNYRLGPGDPFPAMLEDARCAVRFLRAHEADYQIDARKLGVYGDSAGGHLAAMLAVSQAVYGEQPSLEWPDQSSRVQAAAVLFAPLDLTGADFSAFPGLLEKAFGPAANGGLDLQAANPLAFVSSDDPPFLIVQGKHDGTIRKETAVGFTAALQSAGVPVELVLADEGGFSLQIPKAGFPNPERMATAVRLADFFDRWIR